MVQYSLTIKVIKFNQEGFCDNFFLQHVESTFNPDLIIIGGGVSKKMDKFESFITINTPIKAAELKNNAGIIGAVIFAKKSITS